jgi:hypothetical protein
LSLSSDSMSFELSEEQVDEILEGETPDGMEEVSDDKGVRVVTDGENFYKTVEDQELDVLEDIYSDLEDSDRTPETEAKPDRETGKMLVEQPEVPLDLVDAVKQEGLKDTVEEVAELWEEFIDNGYAPKELAPKDLRFTEEGKGVLIDYIDLKGMGKLEEKNMNPQVKTTFNTFADGAALELAAETTRDYEETYQEIAEYLNEATDYIEVPLRGNVNLCKTVYYKGPEAQAPKPV